MSSEQSWRVPHKLSRVKKPTRKQFYPDHHACEFTEENSVELGGTLWNKARHTRRHSLVDTPLVHKFRSHVVVRFHVFFYTPAAWIHELNQTSDKEAGYDPLCLRRDCTVSRILHHGGLQQGRQEFGPLPE